MIQRGNNRCDIFRSPLDHEVFQAALAEALKRFDVDLHAYVQMTNHVHLILTTRDAHGIGLTMQSVGRRYVFYFNRRYSRTGALFEGRYRSFAIDTEARFYRCMRYVEANPVRAGMVGVAHEYVWSSARAHTLGRPDHLLAPHPLYLALGPDSAARARAWRHISGIPLSDDELGQIRETIQRPPTLSRSVEGV